MARRKTRVLSGHGILGGVTLGSGVTDPDDRSVYGPSLEREAGDARGILSGIEFGSAFTTPQVPSQPVFGGVSPAGNQWPLLDPDTGGGSTPMPWSPSMRSAGLPSGLAAQGIPGLTFGFAPSQPAAFPYRSAPAMSETPNASQPSTPGSLPAFTPVGHRGATTFRPWWNPPGAPSMWDPWLQNANKSMEGLFNFFRSRSRPSERRDDENECDRRMYNEKERCFDRQRQKKARGEQYPYLNGCLDRARQRWDKCLQNGYPGGPGELSEWGDADEESWFNPDR